MKVFFSNGFSLESLDYIKIGFLSDFMDDDDIVDNNIGEVVELYVRCENLSDRGYNINITENVISSICILNSQSKTIIEGLTKVMVSKKIGNKAVILLGAPKDKPLKISSTII